MLTRNLEPCHIEICVNTSRENVYGHCVTLSKVSKKYQCRYFDSLFLSAMTKVCNELRETKAYKREQWRDVTAY